MFTRIGLLVILRCMGTILDFGIGPCLAAFTFGLAVFAAILTTDKTSPCHINPGVTLGFLVLGKIDWKRAIVYIVAQYVGCFVGYALLWATIATDANICLLSLRPDLSVAQGFFIEFLGTMVLMFAVCGTTHYAESSNMDSLLGLVIAGVVFAIGPYTGAGLNAARSLPPSVFLNIWKDHWVYEVGPTLGAMFASAFYRYIVDGTEPYSLHSYISKKTIFAAALCYSELEKEKQNGELRKACSKFGHAVQPVRRVNTTSRLSQLRKLMLSEAVLETLPIQAYLVTSGDEHQSTDVDDYEKRREFISGFSGSYGDAIITSHKAALWTDGRYHLQADEQIDCNWLLFREGHKNIPTISDWLKKQLPKGSRIGLNPKLVSEYKWNELTNKLQAFSLELVALNVSLIDMIWPSAQRGAKRTKEAFIYDIKYAGKNYTTKVEEVRENLRKLGADAMVVTSLDEIAWLLNIRGRDVPYSPFLRSYVILDMHNIFLYVNSTQIKNLRAYFHSEMNIIRRSDSVVFSDYDSIWKDLRIKSQLYLKILVPSHCVYSEGASHAIYEHIFADRRLPRQSPIIYLKAKKNPVEIKGMRDANIRDAAAMCDCFAYIEKRVHAGEKLTELDVVDILNEYIYEQNRSLGNSFRTIVGFGANAAYPKYEPIINTNAQIFKNSTLVLDSGGQYLGGTTDITRTLHFGQPTDDMKEAYTRVLAGMIQFSSLTFPSNMKMAVADVLVRASLWEVGLDYLHETGHGTGAFLGVHESPIKIHFDSETSMRQAFKPGYLLSNEPGYYREGEFGIRLENILEVVEKPWLKHSDHSFYGFKILTFVPFEPNLIKFDLLSIQQKKWLNSYNEQVRQLVGEELKRQKRMDGFYWMMEKTKYVPGVGSIPMSQPILTVTSMLLSIIVIVL